MSFAKEGMKVQGQDCRGHKRGRCNECDCENFEYDDEKGANCIYCSCSPTKHMRLDVDSATTSNIEKADVNNLILDETSDTSTLPLTSRENSSTSSSTKSPDASFSNDPKSAPKSTLLQQVQRSFKPRLITKKLKPLPDKELHTLYGAIPSEWNEEIQSALDKGKLKTKQRRFIVRTISLNLRLLKKTKVLHIRHVAVRAVQLYPALLGAFNSLHEGLVTNIRACIKNAKRYNKDCGKENKSTSEKIYESIELMKMEMGRSLQPSMRILNEGMDATRQQRKIDAKDMPAELMLRKYPALKLKVVLMREFSKLINIPDSQLAENWGDALSKIVLNLNLNVPNDSGTDFICLELLQALPRFFRSSKKETQGVLKIYEAGTPIKSVLPNSGKAPYLIGIGDPALSDLDLICYIDGVCLFKARATEAVLLLLAAYWVFNISYHTSTKPQMVFLAATIFREHCTRLMSKDLNHYATVTNLLKDADLA